MKKIMMVVVAVGMAAAAWADAHISYSGQLCLADGSKVSSQTTGTITFRLYESPTENKVLWGREIAVQVDANGFFAVELHDGAGSAVREAPTPAETISLDDIIAKYETLYIGLKVKGAANEIAPRQKLLSTPRAVFAQDVSMARNDFSVKGVAKLSGGIEAGTNKAFTVSNAGNVNVAGTLIAQKEATFAQTATFSKGLSITQGTFGVMPIRTIVMWYGDEAKIPEGWALCDGQVHDGVQTPDLRGRFPVGVGQSTGTSKYTRGSTGGSETVTLTLDQMPSHTHTVTLGQRKVCTKIDGEYWGYAVNGPGNGLPKVWDDKAGWAPESEAAGGNKPHTNIPPYLAVYFIMRVK